MEEVFAIIGKMYVDLYNAQKLIQSLQEDLDKEKDQNKILRQTGTEDE